MIKDKIKTLNQLSRITKSLKKSGKIVAFTNGCFDIIHAGHVKYLEAAKKKCNVLIVGVNSNSSVKKIKGEKRPVINESQRANIIAALESVNYVIIFKEKTPLNLIARLKPNMLIKASDWKKKDIVGADFVKSYGGRVITSPYTKGYSSTSIIKSIVKRFNKIRER